MPRYIDALEIRYTYRPVGGDIAYKDEIEALPPADVAPVVHAHWVRVAGGVHFPFRCSRCGEKADSNEYTHCHCGARMDEDMEEDTEEDV